MVTIRLILIIVSVLLCNLHAAPEVKKASNVFKKWLAWQQVYEPINLAEKSDELAQQLTKAIASSYEAHITRIRKRFLPFLSAFTHNSINQEGHQLSSVKPSVVEQAKELYTTIEQDMPAHLQMLDALNLNQCHSSALDLQEMKIIYEYNALGEVIFGQPPSLRDNQLLFSVANKYAEFCFAPENFALFRSMLMEPTTYPTIRFLYSTISHHFSGVGWHNWSADCLRNLKQASHEGKKVVYLAGGSDLYQLIAHGIYNITIIDPQLPSQPKYYADEWSWLIRGALQNNGVGDQLIFEQQGIMMTRISHQEEGKPFNVELANKQTTMITPSKTVWRIATLQGQPLGTYTIDRRCITQKDFEPAEDKVLLMSFNELFFVAAPDMLDGWHIAPSKLDPSTKIYIKQLHKPVAKAQICNMHTAQLLNNTDFKFIPLGSCIN